MRTIWGEPYEVKVSRAVLKTSSLWRHRELSLTKALHTRTKLVRIAQIAEKLGAGLMMLIPVIALIARIPAAGVLMFLGGIASLGASVLVHLITLPVELDASFNRALPILEKGQYINEIDQKAARKILTACAVTYVASSLVSLLSLWRWIAILRR